jgi:hypothetical protein
MLTSSPLARLRQLCPALPGRGPGRYTPAEVLALLSPEANGPAERRRAVLATAAVPSGWTGNLRDRDTWELGRLADRLPTVVFWHRAGLSLEEIGQRISLFGGPWRARRALEIAAGCIATRLNEGGLTAVRGAE